MGFDDTLEEEVIVTLIATGFNDKNKQFSVPDVLQKKPDAYNEQLNISPSEEGDVSSPFSVKEQIVQKEEEKDDVPPSRIKVDREIPPFLMKLRKMNK